MFKVLLALSVLATTSVSAIASNVKLDSVEQPLTEIKLELPITEAWGLDLWPEYEEVMVFSFGIANTH